jgi:uncharacterized protein YndB with AHSA1/START domain
MPQMVPERPLAGQNVRLRMRYRQAAAEVDGMTDDTAAAAVSLADVGPVIVGTVALADCGPQRALAAFTDAAVLGRWWRGELAARLEPGGEYTVAFPAMGATLTGTVVSYEPGGALEFSWSWDGSPADSTVAVRVTAGPAAGSALVTIEHGPHGEDQAGRTAHQEHWDGWEFFLPRLAAELGG